MEGLREGKGWGEMLFSGEGCGRIKGRGGIEGRGGVG